MKRSFGVPMTMLTRLVECLDTFWDDDYQCSAHEDACAECREEAQMAWGEGEGERKDAE